MARLVELLLKQKQLLSMQTISLAARAEQCKKSEELYRKVCVWRREREEMAVREEKERERERQREEEEREKAEEKMALHRERLKSKVLSQGTFEVNVAA